MREILLTSVLNGLPHSETCLACLWKETFSCIWHNVQCFSLITLHCLNYLLFFYREYSLMHLSCCKLTTPATSPVNLSCTHSTARIPFWTLLHWVPSHQVPVCFQKYIFHLAPNVLSIKVDRSFWMHLQVGFQWYMYYDSLNIKNDQLLVSVLCTEIINFTFCHVRLCRPVSCPKMVQIPVKLSTPYFPSHFKCGLAPNLPNV